MCYFNKWTQTQLKDKIEEKQSTKKNKHTVGYWERLHTYIYVHVCTIRKARDLRRERSKLKLSLGSRANVSSLEGAIWKNYKDKT